MTDQTASGDSPISPRQAIIASLTPHRLHLPVDWAIVYQDGRTEKEVDRLLMIPEPDPATFLVFGPRTLAAFAEYEAARSAAGYTGPPGDLPASMDGG